MEKHGLDRGEWLEKLMRIDQSLKEQHTTAQLTLVGCAASMFAGQPARTSMYLGVMGRNEADL